jgi:hypothetical protein
MASSEVDQKLLGKLAKAVESDNPLLASMLFKILGLSINLSAQLIKARKQRRHDAAKGAESLELHFHIIWLSREGLLMLEQYVLPLVGNFVELKVLAYKLRASFYHIFVLFHNQPPVSAMGFGTPDPAAVGGHDGTPPRLDKGKAVARGEQLVDVSDPQEQPAQSALVPEGGPVGPPPGFGPESAAAFLLPARDYLPMAQQCFRDAIGLAEALLWGSHSLRLSVKTEYAAFLYECVHDAEGSRRLAKDTINEVYEASEGIDNDMFYDACELVTVLGKMMKRGLGSKNQGSSTGTPATPQLQQQQQQRQQQQDIPIASVEAPPGMI